MVARRADCEARELECRRSRFGPITGYHARRVGQAADIELLEAWRAGDRSAGDELFRRHLTSIERFFRSTVEPAAIDDLVQATFIACTEGRDRFVGRSSFRSYLFGVAHNVLKTHYRRRRPHDRIDFECSSLVDLGVGPSTMLEQKREQRLLSEALRQIPLESQIILQRRYWEQLRTAELAEFLAVPRGTAVDRLRRAQTQLRQAIVRMQAAPELLESAIESLGGWAASLRSSDERDASLAVVVPDRLGRRPLTARTHDARHERAVYRGANAEAELTLERVESDELRPIEPLDQGEPGPVWTAIDVAERSAWVRWRPESRCAELRMQVGSVRVCLRLEPAVGIEAVVELVAALALDELE
jgi:RNA polymerase sigma factor (sigma-70 family)